MRPILARLQSPFYWISQRSCLTLDISKIVMMDAELAKATVAMTLTSVSGARTISKSQT